MTTMHTRHERISDRDLRHVRCAVGHSGNTRLYATADRAYAECAGCGHFFTPRSIREADDREHGQGGVRRVGEGR